MSEICPVCGNRYIELRKYTTGDRSYIHTKVLKVKPFPHWDITEKCFVNAHQIANDAKFRNLRESDDE